MGEVNQISQTKNLCNLCNLPVGRQVCGKKKSKHRFKELNIKKLKDNETFLKDLKPYLSTIFATYQQKTAKTQKPSTTI